VGSLPWMRKSVLRACRTWFSLRRTIGSRIGSWFSLRNGLILREMRLFPSRQAGCAAAKRKPAPHLALRPLPSAPGWEPGTLNPEPGTQTHA
jgi:hypothetical protein